MFWHGVLLLITRILLWTWRPPPRHYVYVAAVALAVIVAVLGAERLGIWPAAWKVNPPASALALTARP